MGDTITAASFCVTLKANVDNDRLSDGDFRDFVRNSIASLRDDEEEARVRKVAEALYDEKIAVLGVKKERFAFDRAPQQEQMDYESRARAILRI